jgi:hypothetical protein
MTIARHGRPVAGPEGSAFNAPGCRGPHSQVPPSSVARLRAAVAVLSTRSARLDTGARPHHAGRARTTVRSLGAGAPVGAGAWRAQTRGVALERSALIVERARCPTRATTRSRHAGLPPTHRARATLVVLRALLLVRPATGAGKKLTHAPRADAVAIEASATGRSRGAGFSPAAPDGPAGVRSRARGRRREVEARPHGADAVVATVFARRAADAGARLNAGRRVAWARVQPRVGERQEARVFGSEAVGAPLDVALVALDRGSTDPTTRHPPPSRSPRRLRYRRHTARG